MGKRIRFLIIAFFLLSLGAVVNAASNNIVAISNIDISASGIPIMPGDVFNIRVDTASSDNEQVYYKFYYCPNYGTPDYDSSQWTVVQDYSTVNEASYSMPSIGNYVVVVRAVTDPENEPEALPIIGGFVSVGGDSSQINISGFDSSASPSLAAGESVNFSLNAATPGNDQIYYKFYTCGNYGTSSYSTSAWETIQEYSTANSCSHVFSNPGNYIVVARAVTDPQNEPAALPIIGTNVTVSASPDQGSSGKWRFAVVGDTHVTVTNNTIPAEIAKELVKDGVKLALFPGDLVEGGRGSNSTALLNQLEVWKSTMAPLYAAGIGVYPLRGNHEADVPNNLSAWNTAFSGNYALPGNGPSGETNLSYSFTYNNALFVGLDDYVSLHKVNQTWLDQQLSGNTSKPHVFTFGHEAAFRTFHSDYLGEYPSDRNSFWESLKENGSKVYFCGHDHFFDAARIDDGDGNAADDLIQCVVGTGGGGVPIKYAYNGDNSSYTPKVIYHEAPYGYILVEVSGSGDSDLDVTMTWKQRTLDPASGLYTYVATSDVISYSASAKSSASASGSSVTYKIVDTGQTKSYGNTFEINSPSAGQAFYGQDSQIQGNQPSYQNNGDGTITDLNTGLVWVQARGEKMSWDAAVSGASSCRVGGYSDWRMPTIKELYSLINFTGKSGMTAASCIPYLDANYFEWAAGGTDSQNSTPGNRVIDGQDWSATEYVGTTMNGDATVLGVNFIDGRIKGYPKYKKSAAGSSNNVMFVRYVRGNTSYGINKFVSNSDGTITDLATGLMWAQADSGKGMNWQDALAWVQTNNSANYLGHNDWRMPNAKELQSILDYTRAPKMTANTSRQGSAIDPLFSCSIIFDIDESGRSKSNYPYYWSSTTHLDSNGGVYLAFGEALGWMKFGTSSSYTLTDVHGAGAQRSDPKSGDSASYPYGFGPQGDVVRINNHVRLVRDAN